MKKLAITMLVLCTCIGAYAGNPMKVTSGNGKFLKETATATVTFDWSQAQWNNEKPLAEQWGDEYQKLVAAGEKAFKEGFNENSKKVKIADSDAKYRFDVKITNLDKYYGVMSLVPGYKHKAWGTITVVDVLTNAAVCEMTFEELTGGRDFAIDDSFIKCMSDLGKAVAKTK